ncbi:YraN family protein [Helicobacter bizzozeronii]|uniref:YraN family protein n=1 Tax=Helicobacter bizzozeronii TaxID=56877 RepID=UPI000CF1222B|nr:YraN family protein [Helicobacter bizzozeronii]
MSYAKGLLAEEIACAFLSAQGCAILARNFCCHYGEIDIIALKEGVLHFVEVKSRTRAEPLYAITPAKLGKIHQSIQVFLQENPMPYDFCIDALIIKGVLGRHTLEWLENIGF